MKIELPDSLRSRVEARVERLRQRRGALLLSRQDGPFVDADGQDFARRRVKLNARIGSDKRDHG
jgi:hypothetical protein